MFDVYFYLFVTKYNNYIFFFFIPFDYKYNPMTNQFNFNKTELERCRKFGFEKKLEQSIEVRKYGIVFTKEINNVSK